MLRGADIHPPIYYWALTLGRRTLGSSIQILGHPGTLLYELDDRTPITDQRSRTAQVVHLRTLRP